MRGTSRHSERFSDRAIQQLAVLLVDDNLFMRKIVRGLLSAVGVRIVLEANDGVEALDMIRTAPPDVIILDWEMPLLNGAELVRIVRSAGTFPTPDIPIIMLTAHADASRLKEAVALGVDDFLCKPVSAKALHDRLTMLVARPGHRPQTRVPKPA